MSRQFEDPNNEIAEGYRALREWNRDGRARSRKDGSLEIVALAAEGYVVKVCGDHFRVNGVLDLYPTHRRYHHVRTQQRGGYHRESALAVCRRLLKGTA